MKNNRRVWRNIRYWLFFGYLEWMHNKILYRRRYFVNGRNVPPAGEPLVIVSNHQNALNDPLAIEFGFRNRIVSIFARGDIFSNKIVGRFLKFLYILPAYRMRTDGYESVNKNYESFDEAHERLLEGGTVAIFPEGTNQDKRWLGDFSQGYLRMAFGAAEKCGFTKDIRILPIANHYSNYFHIQSDMLITCGTPISLQPYYELYRTKPRTAQREVNRLVRSQVSELMLDIADLDNYESIDYLRDSYGVKYAKDNGWNPNRLPDKLKSDKRFVKELDAVMKQHPLECSGIYGKTLQLKDTARKYNVRDWNFDKRYSCVLHFLEGMLFLVALPLFLFALIPNIAAFYAPKRIVRKFAEKGSAFAMFAGGIQFALNTILVLPVCYTVVFAADWLAFNWIFALCHLCALPWLGLFAWYYRILFIKWNSMRRFAKALKQTDMQQAVELRKKIWQTLDRYIGRNE